MLLLAELVFTFIAFFLGVMIIHLIAKTILKYILGAGLFAALSCNPAPALLQEESESAPGAPRHLGFETLWHGPSGPQGP